MRFFAVLIFDQLKLRFFYLVLCFDTLDDIIFDLGNIGVISIATFYR